VFVSVGSTVDDEYADLDYRSKHKGELTGLTSGYASIDQLTSGWQNGDLVVIAARPSIGKTALTLNMACAASDVGKQVAFFSLEMRRSQLQKRLLAHLSGVPMNLILSGDLAENNYARLANAMEVYGKLTINVNDRARQTVGDIRTACRLLKSQKRLDLVIIDYFQLMAGSSPKGSNRNEQLTEISRRLKVLADEVSCPVILLSQLNRAGDTRSDKRPILSDLRDTGALEQDADLVGFLHRKHHREDGVTQFIIEKQRNGPGGTVNLTIRRDTQTFEDGGVEPDQPALAEAPEPVPHDPQPPAGYGGRRRWRSR
jgi:replicative DNA helicase